MPARRVWATSDDGLIEYVSITKDLLQPSIEAMQKSFYIHENVCVAFNMQTEPESFAEMDYLLLRAAKDGVSVAAVERATGKVAGATFNKLEEPGQAEFYPQYVESCKHSATRGVTQWMCDIENMFNVYEHCKVGGVMEIMFLGIVPEFRKKGKIEYISLTADILEEVVQILRISFFAHENVCKATGLSKIPEAVAECDDMVISTAKHGVSVVAIEKETGKIAGAILNKIQDKNTSSKKFYEDYIKNAKYPEARGIFEFLVEMEDSIDPFSLYNADCLMELVFLGVHPDYSKRGIGYRLCEVSVQLASLLYKGENIKTPLDDTPLPLEPRPQVLTALFTSYKSQKIGRKLNFDIVRTTSYQDLYYDGKSYASVPGVDTLGLTVECKKL